MNKIINVAVEFGKQVLKYLKHFGLIEADLARLINSNTDDISEIASGSKGIVLKSADKIANVFGLRYFEFGNPNFPLPEHKELPDKTQLAIHNRKKKGVPQINRNYENDIAGNLDKIIHETNVLHRPVTADMIRLNFPEDIRSKIKAIQITDLLKKSGRNKIVVNIGKEGKAYLFQLKEFVGK